MKKAKLWNGGRPATIGNLEGCLLWWRHDGYCYQYKVRYGFLELIREPMPDNKSALNNVINELKNKLKINKKTIC